MGAAIVLQLRLKACLIVDQLERMRLWRVTKEAANKKGGDHSKAVTFNFSNPNDLSEARRKSRALR